MKKSNQIRYWPANSALAVAMAMGLCSVSPPLLADGAGAFLGGMVTSRVLTNMHDRTEAEQIQADAAVRQSQAAAPPASSAPSVEERIHTLDQLRANGTISKSEYESRKKAILDSI